jgi:hypothetical protein
MLFSILIPTLESRRTQFERLQSTLNRQVHEHGLADAVEILSLLDNGEHSVGVKRNALIAKANGRFVAFVDDDDATSDDYVPLICRVIRERPDIDCIGITGLITFAGRHPRRFVHSVQYRHYFTRGGTYFRPPYHLNPIRRDIAARFRFADISYSEDIDWAMRLCEQQVLKREYFIDSVLYYYHSRRPWVYQVLLDRSEAVRHRLGLQLVNRLRVKRWLSTRRGDAPQ